MGIICCVTGMIITESKLLHNSAGSLFGLKLPLELRKELLILQKKKGETESFISDTSPCIVALMTRSNAYVSATRPRKH